MLSSEKARAYKERLERDREKLFAQIKEGGSRLDFGDDVDSFDEEADEAEEMGAQLGIENVLRKRISRIDAALDRIKSGAYGICKKCGKEIPKRILDAAPESALCDKCKK